MPIYFLQNESNRIDSNCESECSTMEPFQVLVVSFSRTACCFQSRITYFALRRMTLLVPPEVFPHATWTSFSKPAFRVWTRSKTGFWFWIFTNENGEADNRIEEKCIYGAHTVVLRNSTDCRLYIRWNEVKMKDKIINKFSYIQLISDLSVDTSAVLQQKGCSLH